MEARTRAIVDPAAIPRLLAGVACLAGLLCVDPVFGMRCGTQLISEGDFAYEVRRACGSPSAVQPLGSPLYRDHGPSEELWYYDFGDNRLVRVLHFREGRLRRITTSERGLSPGEGDGRCTPADISAGMSSYRLLRICGEPVQRERRYVRRSPYPERHPHLVQDVLVEEWIYEFGSTYLARLVRLEDGTVVSVETRP